jgi:RNA polymerase sigma factor (sigma-70 family)
MRQSDRAREDQFRAYVLQSRGSLLRTATLLASGNAHLDERRRPYARHERNHAKVPDVVVEEARPSDTEGAVFRALAELPPRMRVAVILRHLHDASVAEAADALGSSEGTVKSQTARGLAQLRAALSELVDGTGDRAVQDTANVGKGTAHE